MATIEITQDWVQIERPQLPRYEPEWEFGRGHFGFTIDTTAERDKWEPVAPGSSQLKPVGKEVVPVKLLFDRGCGELIHSTNYADLPQVAERLGLVPAGSGWRLPDEL